MMKRYGWSYSGADNRYHIRDEADRREVCSFASKEESIAMLERLNLIADREQYLGADGWQYEIRMLYRTLGSAQWLDSLNEEEWKMIRDGILPVVNKHAAERRSDD